LGTYRFLLALAVAVAHAGTAPLHLGVAAVISFYILSGFVMTALIERYYLAPEKVMGFYLDRAMRLYPQFIVYFFASLALMWWKPDAVFSSGLTPLKAALNLPIAPLGLYMVFDLGNAMVIPQAWSLGLEVMFYLVIPWIVLYADRRIVAALSLVVFLIAYFGVLNADYFAYRLLPGTLFMFLAGGMIFKLKDRALPPTPIAALWVLVATLLVGTWVFPQFNAFYNRAVLAGLLVGLPAAWLLRHGNESKLDARLGNLSYGVFLNHIFIIWTIEAVTGSDEITGLETVIMLAVSVPLSYLTYSLAERPILHLRRMFRDRPRLPKIGDGTAQFGTTPLSALAEGSKHLLASHVLPNS
jgi:peptidoglycan/LPS O-acetylase OafA/YrhL